MHRQLRRLVQLPLGCDLDQFARDLADALLEFGFARLPATAAEPVQFDIGLVGAVARQQFDVLDRQEQLGVGGIVQFDAVVRRAGDLQRLQTDETADTVLDMHHEIAGGEARDLRDEIIELAGRLARPHQAVAQDVLFADDGDVVGLEPAFHAEHGQHGLVARRRLHRAPRVDAGDVRKLVVPQHAGHAVARALTPKRDHHLLALGLQSLDVGHHRLEHVGGAVVAFRREVAALAGADIDDTTIVRDCERREPCHRRLPQPPLPLRLRQIEAIGR